MKIERKKGLKSIKVTHNKGVFWTAVVLFVILIGIVVSIRIIGNNEHNSGNQTAECSSDSDCAIVQTSACSCNMGGSDACIPKSESGKYNFSQPASPEKGETVCAAVYNCKIKSCSCISGKCTGLEQ